MLGELLSKVAIVVTLFTIAQVGWIGGAAAVILAAIGVGLSFLRDANLRQRGIARRLPALGWVWALSLLVAALLMAVVRALAGEEVLETPAIFVMAGLVAIGVRLICIGVDGFVDWIFSLLWPVLERVLTQLSGTSTARDNEAAVQEPQEYRTALPEPRYGGFVPPMHWRYQCPRCGARVEHKIDVCWNCGYGSGA